MTAAEYKVEHALKFTSPKLWKTVVLLNGLPSIITYHDSLHDAIEWVGDYSKIQESRVDAIKFFRMAPAPSGPAVPETGQLSDLSSIR
jgi:hypothetical protein